MEQYQPDSEAALQQVIQEAMAQQTPLKVQGSGSMVGFGRPVEAGALLSLEKLSGIVDYQPEELLLTVKPGTARAEVQEVLAAKGQRLAFDPQDLGPLYGLEPGLGTIGGMIGAGLTGPGRLKHGAARDHILAVQAVSGRGEVFKAGGKVVKNVTGYDLPKLLTGSFGTLAVLSEITLKVLPAPEKTYTVLAYGLDVTEAVRLMSEALSGPHEVSAASYLPPDMAAGSEVDLVRQDGVSVLALRLEGPGPSVKYRCQALRAVLDQWVSTEELHSHRSLAFWREVRDVLPLLKLVKGEGKGKALWRLSVPPASSPKVVTALDCPYLMDWAGGLLWLVNDGADPRPAIEGCGGQVTLMWGRSAEAAVFQTLGAPYRALTQQLKAAFDPQGLLNPGRMYEGV